MITHPAGNGAPGAFHYADALVRAAVIAKACNLYRVVVNTKATSACVLNIYNTPAGSASNLVAAIDLNATPTGTVIEYGLCLSGLTLEITGTAPACDVTVVAK